MLSAWRMVESRCATTTTVRPPMSESSAACTSFSLSVSSADVASSSSRILPSASGAEQHTTMELEVKQASRAPPRVRHDGARDGDALLLPAAQLRAALTAQRIVLARQRVDEGVRVGHVAGLFHLGLRRALLAVPHVVRDGRREEHGLPTRCRRRLWVMSFTNLKTTATGRCQSSHNSPPGASDSPFAQPSDLRAPLRRASPPRTPAKRGRCAAAATAR
mmetsp:Transcript_16859/g.46082  ORF Transcript_16859/g.46082 Transcript_16859/m.46082 type:complete len:219 (+) Transcript_16859:229-885(+)